MHVFKQLSLVFRMLIFTAVFVQQINTIHSRNFKMLQQEPPKRKKKIQNE